ncbi:RNA polymerase sigma factor [Variovorax sp. CT11-76]
MPDRFKAALRTLFLARYAQFRKHLHMRLGSEDLANDALQETFLRVENSTVRSEVRYPSAYLFRIALNVAEDQRKSNARLLSVDEMPHKDIATRYGVSVRTVEKELRAGLEHCCERLGRDFIQRFGPGAGKQSKQDEG